MSSLQTLNSILPILIQNLQGKEQLSILINKRINSERASIEWHILQKLGSRALPELDPDYPGNKVRIKETVLGHS